MNLLHGCLVFDTSIRYHWFYFIFFFAALSACQKNKQNIPEPDYYPHILKTGEYVSLTPKVISLDTMTEPEYVDIESKYIGNVVPEYIPREKNYRIAGEPTYYPDQGTIVFADSTAAVSIKTSPKRMPGQWPKWTPYQPVKKESTKLQIEYLGEENGLKSIYNVAIKIIEDRNKNIWLSTRNSVYMFDGVGFSHFTSDEGILKDEIWTLLEDRNGRIWIGQRARGYDPNAGGLYIWDGQNISRFTTEEGLSTNYVSSLLEDSKGQIWIGTYIGLEIWDGEQMTHYTQNEGFQISEINCFLEDKSGNIWIGTVDGLYTWDGNNFKQFLEDNGKFSVRDFSEDKAGHIWIATNKGLFVWDGAGFKKYTQSSGLLENEVTSLVEDRDDNLWMINGGLTIWDGTGFTTYTEEDGFVSVQSHYLFKDDADNIWTSNFGYGMNIFKPGGFEDMTPDFEKIVDQDCKSYLLAGQDGNMWIGSDFHGLYSWDGEGFTNYAKGENITTWIRRVIEDRQGKIWYGSWKGL